MVELVRSLAALDTAHEIVVFAHRNGRDLIGIPERPGFKWAMVPPKGAAARLLWEQTALPLLVRRSRLDVLHSLHYTRPLMLPCASVVTFCDMTFFLYPELHTHTKRFLFPLFMRTSARRANALIAISENTRRDAIRLLGIPPEKIFTTPLGISKKFHPVSDPNLLCQLRRKYGLPETFILYVGTLEPRKNLPFLLKSYKNLVDAGNPTALVIVGRLGWMYDAFFKLVNTLELKEKIILPGYVPAEDLPGLYTLARVFVYPSLYEGFGFPPLEAMACGTPVITTTVSAMPEHVGDAALLIPPHDEEALTRALQTLLCDRSQHQALSVKGPRQAAFFSWARTARQTLAVYEHIGPGKPRTVGKA